MNGRETHLSVTAHDDYVDRLHYLKETILFLDATLDTVVKEARDAGVPWQSIAGAVGISKQGAQQRWGRTIPDPHQMTLDGGE